MSRYWTNLADLYEEGLLTETAELIEVAKAFQIKISPTIQKQLENVTADERDALIRQFIPSPLEANILPTELDDPIGDRRFTPIPGVVHRYKDRALLKITQLCEVYCRFCFRKEMIGQKGATLSESELKAAITYFQAHTELWEVILTGGDPLILSARRLQIVFEALCTIPHIQNIRIHSRIPIISPEKITPELLMLLENCIDQGKAITLVIHANHASEFSEDAKIILKKLRKAGVLLLSQSVLLKDINDSIPALTALMRAFIINGIKPYYLHQMDLARGTSHFVVEEARAIKLVETLRQEISGICIPRLIVEIPEGEGKRALA